MIVIRVPELIVMLTHNDYTVKNAYEVFEACKNTKAVCWGLKEEGIEEDEMKALYARMHECGKTTFLEVVSYGEADGLAGAELAVRTGADVLLGTMYYDSINEYCKDCNLRYMPFVGTLEGRPSVLNGKIEEIMNEARSIIAKEVYGIDLLGYRYTGDPEALNTEVLKCIDRPVVLAGSINSFERLHEVYNCGPRWFTIGSAFFDHKFGDSIAEQIDIVYDYMQSLAE